MTKTITGETPFSVLAHSFALSPSAQGYTLNYSADGINWTAWSEATPSGENLVVNGVARDMYFKCVGNTDELVLTY